ncbi:MAG TPA: flagellar biosynthetic protein FliO [Sedimenticola thiotaurini]|uniref:Flagellar protein n=1 Tax=Sedimenticola thiotaurini TaxID=1543721 RepID=A0A831RM18_9GAMM|nr:flagellar biosynthetic protein FliO [Sedimenticola thiotaurini]
MRSPARSLLPLLAGVLPLTAIAAGDTDKPGYAAPDLGTGAMLETLGGLLVIIGVILALGWLYRRFGRLTPAGKGAVSILGGISLGPRERAVLLQVEGTRLLVGVAPGRVQTLHVLEGEAAAGFERQLDAALEEGRP